MDNNKRNTCCIISKKENDRTVYNLINKNGVILLNEWFDNISQIKDTDDLLFIIEKDYKFNVVNSDGTILFDKFYNLIFYVRELNLFRIFTDSGSNYINLNNELLFKKFYKPLEYISYLNIFFVREDTERYFIDTNENRVNVNFKIDDSFVFSYTQSNSIENLVHIIRKNGEENIITKDLKLAFKNGVDRIIYKFENQDAYIYFNKEKLNFYNATTKFKKTLLKIKSGLWKTSIFEFDEDTIIININKGESIVIDSLGNIQNKSQENNFLIKSEEIRTCYNC